MEGAEHNPLLLRAEGTRVVYHPLAAHSAPTAAVRAGYVAFPCYVIPEYLHAVREPSPTLRIVSLFVWPGWEFAIYQTL